MTPRSLRHAASISSRLWLASRRSQFRALAGLPFSLVPDGYNRRPVEGSGAFPSSCTGQEGAGSCSRGFAASAAQRGAPARKRPKTTTGGRQSGGGVHADEEREMREAALQQALSSIESSFGPGAVMRLGEDAPGLREVPVISTGSLALDVALGVGGLPKGRVVEIFGPEASGKTTLALHVIAEAQKKGGMCAFIDAEHALDTTFAQALGVQTKDFYVAQPSTGEEALTVADTLVRSGVMDVVVVDSVAALVPRAELMGDMGDAHMALQARLMSQALRKLTHSLSRSKTILIFINQIRNKLATFGSFGAPTEVTSGGNALKFYASVRLNIRRVAYLKKGEEISGSSVRVKVAKNKVAPPFRTAEFDIEFGGGISQEGEVLDLGVREGVLGKSGNWYSYNGQNFANGRENAKVYLKQNEELAMTLRQLVSEALRGPREQGAAGAVGTSHAVDDAADVDRMGDESSDDVQEADGSGG